MEAFYWRAGRVGKGVVGVMPDLGEQVLVPDGGGKSVL